MGYDVKPFEWIEAFIKDRNVDLFPEMFGSLRWVRVN